MTAIEKINRLDHPGVLREFTWPGELSPFGRFNLIYGWNGSGKTTISRILRDLERGKRPPASSVLLSIRGQTVSETQFPQAPVQVRTFNSDFVREAVFRVDGQEMSPIFVVGRDSVEKQRRLEQLRVQKEGKERDLGLANRNFEAADRALDRHRIDCAREIKAALRVHGSGPYNEYDKTAYSARLQQMLQSGETDAHTLDHASHGRFLSQYRAPIKRPLSELRYSPPSVSQLRDEFFQICESTVVSSALQSLEQDPPLGEWVRQGLRLHQERKSPTCLFCEQTLAGQRLSSLEAHFSAEYDRFLGRVDAFVGQLRAVRDQAKSEAPPDSGLLYDDLSEDYQAATEALAKMKTGVEDFASELVQHLEEKRRHPFRKLRVDIAVPEVASGIVDRVNEVIRSHNGVCEDFQSRVDAAGRRLADGMIAASVPEHARLEAGVADAQAPMSSLRSEIGRLGDEIARLEREILEHLQPAEELNDDLRQYLGHDEIRVEVRENGYVLTRGGVPALALSEGEKTALALLYFLKSLHDRSFDMRKGVVVLDDPVSSLDANSLYLASGFIRERTQGAGQLFVLTHNFSFFREIRNWFKHVTGQKSKNAERRPARFYMLEFVPGADPRRAAIRPLDPLLEKFESEYHYLFSCVYLETRNQNGLELERSYLLPNVARRLLEMFLAFRRPHIHGHLWEKMKDIEFDSITKTRILRFVNAHSHGDIIGEPEHDPSQLGEARAVLTDLLQFMRAQDPQHVDAMIELVDAGDEPDAAEP